MVIKFRAKYVSKSKLLVAKLSKWFTKRCNILQIIAEYSFPD